MAPTATEMAEVLERGVYPGPGQPVGFGEALASAVASARVVSASGLGALAAEASAGAAPVVEVCEESTASVVARLGSRVGVLVFADAAGPGGGFERGEAGQEEDLCRASALLPCLRAVPAFYDAQRTAHALLHSGDAAVFESVPLLRTESGWLAAPVLATMVVMAAPDARGLVRSGQADLDLEPILTERVRGQLALFRSLGVRTLVLGAWGCGAYGNDPRDVATVYRRAVNDSGFGGAFDRVIFAISDRRSGAPSLAGFHRVLSRQA